MELTNEKKLSPEYRMGYMNSILLYYILKLLDTSKEKTLPDEIYELAKKTAFGDIIENIEVMEDVPKASEIK